MKHDGINIPMSIIISGVESDTYWDIVVSKCEMKTVLMSYHYLQKKGKSFLAKRIEAHPEVKVFIDSGAHTFLSNMDKFENMPDKYWEDYLEGYTNWVRANKDYVFACADLDIDFLVGEEKVNEWRKKYFEPLEEEGIQVCYIWHSNRGQTGWEDMCKKYSYIGLSMENDSTMTIQKLMKMLNVAKKYNTRVHGMALTKTEILVRVPFFSADSTTWLVGQQYGELNWFDGRKMRRLGKNEWRRNFKTKLIKAPFNGDWDRLINGMGGRGDTYELLRLNVIAYRLAEEHIRKRLNAKMYWMSKGAYKNSGSSSKSSLSSKKLPIYDWFFDDYNEGWEGYLQEFGISPEDYTKEEAVNILYYFYLFIEKDEEHLDEISDEELINYASTVLEEEIEDRESAVEGLRDYFLQNATGERTDFIGESGSYQSKEREKYVEEEAFSVIDLSAEDISSSLALLPPPEDDMPEITAFDEELKRNNIVAVRDSQGRFVKGKKLVKKQKDVYSSKYPKLACDTCYKSGECPQYKAGYVCAFDKMFKRFDSRNLDDIIESMQGMVNMNMERLQRALIFETMDGGMPTGEVTGLIDQNMRLLEKMRDVANNAPKAVVSQRRVIKEDGSEEVVTEMNVSNPVQGGILSQLFSQTDERPKKAPKKKNKDEGDGIVDVDYEVSEE